MGKKHCTAKYVRTRTRLHFRPLSRQNPLPSRWERCFFGLDSDKILPPQPPSPPSPPLSPLMATRQRYLHTVVRYLVCNYSISRSLPASSPTPCPPPPPSLPSLLKTRQCFNVGAVEGAWVVFAPFPPCLAWALAMRTKWLATRDGGGAVGVKTKEE